MTVFGFLATIIICATVIGVVFLLSRKPISFRIIKTTEMPKQTVEVNSKKVAEEAAKPAEVIDKKPQASMDNVISAVNELMGIPTITKEDVDGRQD